MKLSTEEFILRATAIHDNKYDYTKINYINNTTKVLIFCPSHGHFLQSPKVHLRGGKCKLCANEQRGSNQRISDIEFIRRAKIKHCIGPSAQSQPGCWKVWCWH